MGRGSLLSYGQNRLWTRAGRVGRRCLPVLVAACLLPVASQAQVLDIIGIINTAVKKVIVAADLTIEKEQTSTIEAQATERGADNEMQASELSGIAGWVQEQRDLFAAYYEELREVKAALSAFEAVKEMIDEEARTVAGYSKACSVLSTDSHFSAGEVAAMSGVLAGIASRSAENIARLNLVVTSLVTQMDDGARLRLIDETGSAIDKNYRDMADFSQQAYLMSAQRSRDAGDLAAVKALYGIQ